MANYSHPHICQCLSRLLGFRRHFPVTVTGNRRKTGQQLVEEVLSLAQGLLHLGLAPGHVVAMSAYNSDKYLEWLLAVAFVGGIAAPLNYRWSFEETRLALAAVKPVLLVTDESSATWYSKLQQNDIPSLKWHILLDSASLDFTKWNVLTPEMIKRHPVKLEPFDYSWAPEGTVIICFTSGTTGKPKGVTLSHGALIIQSLAKIAIVGYNEDDVYLHTAPLCHIGGLSSAMTMLMVGGCHVLMPKFDAESAVGAIEQYAVTSFITVPAIMASLISVIRPKEIWKGGETVKKILNGGGSLSHELIKDSSIFFHKAKLISAYGMTETCSSLTFLMLCDPVDEKTTMSLQTFGVARSKFIQQPQGICVGKPAPHVELKISADASGLIGRILTRGPHIMLRYWETHTNPLSPNNEAWLDTGDIGSIDHYGNLWLLGRTNGRIKSGGENIYPEEVEAIILQHPGITSVVVVGIPDAHLTEMVAACIQLRENWQWSEQLTVSNEEFNLSRKNLQLYCIENHLSRFKIPKMFIAWKKPFPLTTTGKIRRDQVRKEVMSQLQSLHSNL
ncbi:2-succinylbenzoate--CoA ligase, chloroplastic/peroxisomal isoform X1 [Vigna radiata var. radiata]|uniref:2-succinylbenzoate--CoA ligase, chloroplastic/peroxisomal isoform X1 n=2 Tax=Vigna radiata var. radiata TaxID=3916 RepID=A0A1S3VKP4_VIGRR|nr:2-succinylbenzoate--CoA ligase, chloroplastic/peroxisomal isoform X1 [Vigna radiata var. radiata]